jgi:hypothetical protein
MQRKREDTCRRAEREIPLQRQDALCGSIGNEVGPDSFSERVSGCRAFLPGGVNQTRKRKRNGVDGWTAILARLMLCSIREKKNEIG